MDGFLHNALGDLICGGEAGGHSSLQLQLQIQSPPRVPIANAPKRSEKRRWVNVLLSAICDGRASSLSSLSCVLVCIDWVIYI